MQDSSTPDSPDPARHRAAMPPDRSGPSARPVVPGGLSTGRPPLSPPSVSLPSLPPPSLPPVPGPPAAALPAQHPDPESPAAGGRPPVRRAPDLASFLAAAREQSSAAEPGGRPTLRPGLRGLRPARAPEGRAARPGARGSRRTGGRRSSPGRRLWARRHWRPVVVLVVLVSAITLLSTTRPAGHAGTAGGEPLALPSTVPAPAPAARATPPVAGAPASVAAASPAGAPRTPRAAPVPAGSPWARVVTSLLGARSTAFARGRPELLLAADAPGSPVLRADRQLFASAVRAAGYQRVAGLAFDLTDVRPLSVTATAARIAVTGRQRASVLIGPGGSRTVPAGRVRTVVLELERLPGSPGWRLHASRPGP